MNLKHTINYMMGMQVNDWKIIGIRPNKRKAFVLAQCVCGKIKEVRARSIRTQVSKNCGCKKGIKLRGKQKILGTDSALTGLFSSYRTTAKRRNFDFNLSIEEFKEITSKNCYYCEIEPSSRMEKHKYIYYYNGIDRVDNSKGYIKGNIVPCCTQCNTKKGGMSLDMVKKVMEFLNEKI